MEHIRVSTVSSQHFTLLETHIPHLENQHFRCQRKVVGKTLMNPVVYDVILVIFEKGAGKYIEKH